MAFSLFGTRSAKPDPETPAEEAPEPKRGFFDRMKQAVTPALATPFPSPSAPSSHSPARSTLLSLDKLEAVLLSSDIGTATTSEIIENLKQRSLRQGIDGGAELRRLLKIELKAVLDRVAVPYTPPADVSGSRHDGRRQRHWQDHHVRQARRTSSVRRGPHRPALRRRHLPCRRYRAARSLGRAFKRPNHQNQARRRSLQPRSTTPAPPLKPVEHRSSSSTPQAACTPRLT